MRKDNSLDILRTMRTSKGYLLIYLPFLLLTHLSLPIKMLLTHGGDGAVGPESNEHGPSVGGC